MKSWRTAAILLLCLILAGSVACSPFGGNGEEEAGPQLVEVVRGDLTISVSASGNIATSQEVNLNFGSAGEVDKVYVEEGDEVTKSEVLAELDTEALELALDEAEAAVDVAEYNLHQLKYVLNGSCYDIGLAESQLEVLEQVVRHIEQQIERATIKAPFDGIVASVSAEEGNNVMATTTIIYLVDPTSLELKAQVDEIDIPSVEPNQKAIISVDALPKLQLEGKVASIGPLPSVEGGVALYDVTISFALPENSNLRIGMSATADIIIEERGGVLLVPNRAIRPDSQGNPIVEVMVDEQIEERPVDVGISDGLQAEIISGLSEGELVVIETSARSSGGGGFLFE